MRSARGVLVLSVALLVLGGARGRAVVDPALFGNLHWRSIGPAATGGRIDDIAVARVPGLKMGGYQEIRGGRR